VIIINLNLTGKGDLLYEISLYELCRNVTVATAGNSLDGAPSLRDAFLYCLRAYGFFAFIGILYKV
jgi:hypothetical protein